MTRLDEHITGNYGEDQFEPRYEYEVDYLSPTSDMAQFYGAPAFVRDSFHNGGTATYRTSNIHEARNLAEKIAKILRKTAYLIRTPEASSSLADREIIETFDAPTNAGA